MTVGIGYTHTCPVCGRKWQIAPYQEWGWKYGSRCVCSYHCMREMERRDAGQQKPRRMEKLNNRRLPTPLSPAEKSQILRLRAMGMRCAEISRRLDRPDTTISQFLRKAGAPTK